MITTANRKRFRITAVCCTLVLALCFFLFWAGIRYFTGAESDRYMNTSARQAAQSLAERFAGEIRELQAVAEIIDANSYSDPRLCAELLNCISQKEYCRRLGIITADGTAYDTDGSIYTFTGIEIFKNSSVEIANGFRGIITGRYADTDNTPIHLFAVEVSLGELDKGYIYSIIEAQTLTLLLGEAADYGYYCVVDSDGGYVVDSGSDSGYSSLESDEYRLIINNYKSGMTAGDKDEMRYSVAPLGFNGWHVIYMLETSAVNEYGNKILLITYIIGVVLLVITIIGFVSYYRHEVRQKLQQLRLSHTDALTGIANYEGMKSNAAPLLALSEANAFVVAEIGINDFDKYNALFGYAKGDNVIKFIAGLLTEKAGENEYICRSGGDKFLMILRNSHSEELKLRLYEIERLIAASESKFTLSLSTGVFIVSDPLLPFDVMRDRAAVARKSAQDGSAASPAFYDSDMHLKRLAEAKIVTGMTNDISNNEYVPFFHPVISLSSGECVGAEALARKINADGQIIPPSAFVDAFERNGQITQLDLYIFECICQAISKMNSSDIKPKPISINISRTHFYDPEFINKISELSKRYGVMPELLTFELSELIFDRKDSEIFKITRSLRNAGSKIAVDNFGMTSSSLNLLLDIPVDIVKLDRHLLYDAMSNEKGKIVLDGLMGIIKALGIRSIAEGVESKAQEDFLKNLGCDYAQGFYYTTPLKYEDFIHFKNPKM